MLKNSIDTVDIGADRITANAKVINKFSTCSIAIPPMKAKTSFKMAMPSSSTELNMESGQDDHTENRRIERYKVYGSKRLVSENIDVFNLEVLSIEE